MTGLIPESETRSPVTAAFSDRTTPFLAPPTAPEDAVASRASDRGEVAMHRLRHPFVVVAATVPRAQQK
ncbi:hypothetical protein GCM10010199_17570 [Dactylosporangium roseum]